MTGIAFRELSPVSFLERAAAVFADRPAVVDGDRRDTYAQLWDRAQRLAGLLAARGVEPGDRVAVLSPNTHLLLEAHYGVPLAGAVLVALNTRLAPSEIAYIVEHSGASLVLLDAEFREVLGEQPIPVIDSESYDDLVDAAEPHRVEVTDERSLLSINYTSGTTGRPKGVMYHHRGAYLQALAMAYHAKLDTSSQYLWTLPMFHTKQYCRELPSARIRYAARQATRTAFRGALTGERRSPRELAELGRPMCRRMSEPSDTRGHKVQCRRLSCLAGGEGEDVLCPVSLPSPSCQPLGSRCLIAFFRAMIVCDGPSACYM